MEGHNGARSGSIDSGDCVHRPGANNGDQNFRADHTLDALIPPEEAPMREISLDASIFRTSFYLHVLTDSTSSMSFFLFVTYNVGLGTSLPHGMSPEQIPMCSGSLIWLLSSAIIPIIGGVRVAVRTMLHFRWIGSVDEIERASFVGSDVMMYGYLLSAVLTGWVPVFSPPEDSCNADDFFQWYQHIFAVLAPLFSLIEGAQLMGLRKSMNSVLMVSVIGQLHFLLFNVMFANSLARQLPPERQATQSRLLAIYQLFQHCGFCAGICFGHIHSRLMRQLLEERQIAAERNCRLEQIQCEKQRVELDRQLLCHRFERALAAQTAGEGRKSPSDSMPSLSEAPGSTYSDPSAPTRETTKGGGVAPLGEGGGVAPPGETSAPALAESSGAAQVTAVEVAHAPVTFARSSTGRSSTALAPAVEEVEEEELDDSGELIVGELAVLPPGVRLPTAGLSEKLFKVFTGPGSSAGWTDLSCAIRGVHEHMEEEIGEIGEIHQLASKATTADDGGRLSLSPTSNGRLSLSPTPVGEDGGEAVGHNSYIDGELAVMGEGEELEARFLPVSHHSSGAQTVGYGVRSDQMPSRRQVFAPLSRHEAVPVAERYAKPPAPAEYGELAAALPAGTERRVELVELSDGRRSDLSDGRRSDLSDGRRSDLSDERRSDLSDVTDGTERRVELTDGMERRPQTSKLVHAKPPPPPMSSLAGGEDGLGMSAQGGVQMTAAAKRRLKREKAAAREKMMMQMALNSAHSSLAMVKLGADLATVGGGGYMGGGGMHMGGGGSGMHMGGGGGHMGGGGGMHMGGGGMYMGGGGSGMHMGGGGGHMAGGGVRMSGGGGNMGSPMAAGPPGSAPYAPQCVDPMTSMVNPAYAYSAAPPMPHYGAAPNQLRHRMPPNMRMHSQSMSHS